MIRSALSNKKSASVGLLQRAPPVRYRRVAVQVSAYNAAKLPSVSWATKNFILEILSTELHDLGSDLVVVLDNISFRRIMN